MGIVSNENFKKNCYLWGRGGGRGGKEERVREGMVASACVVWGDAEMLIIDIT